MRAELTEIHWLDHQHELSIKELAELSRLSEAELYELVDCGAIVPVDLDATPWMFRADCLAITRSAFRLRNDFELDPRGLSVALNLLERVQELESQLRQIRAQLPRRVRLENRSSG
jgi:chaperone modulatory protein CbpM